MSQLKIGKIVIIGLVVVLVLLFALSALWIIRMAPFEQTTAASPEVQVGPIYETEEFTVNLSETISHYIKAKFAIELSNEKAKEELEEKLPLLQDMVIMILSGQTLDVLSTVEGKEDLKENMIKAINSFLEKGQVTKIYFKDFIFS